MKAWLTINTAVIITGTLACIGLTIYTGWHGLSTLTFAMLAVSWALWAISTINYINDWPHDDSWAHRLVDWIIDRIDGPPEPPAASEYTTPDPRRFPKW